VGIALHSVVSSWEKRLGKASEHQIQSRLDYFSHTQKLENDVGIDFYCELIENKTPTHEFYVQAKGTEHFDENWRAIIKKSTIVYWLQKPNPVFLIVYDEPNDSCYWMSIEDYRFELIDKMKATVAKTISLVLNRTHTLEQGKDKNNEFIQKIKDNRLSIALFLGQAKFKGEGYVKQLPDPPRNKMELVRVRETVRTNLYSLVIHYFRVGDLKTAYSYCEFLAKFDPTGHYNHFVWLGLINLEWGKKETAKKNFERALWICKEDKNWPKESINNIVKDIESLMELCE
jgi:tetratricopeptide (TPR) repeat protein